ncbi:hypothetical protein OsI_09117 [Oryza sativa Indica Group]|uniref:Uncharacterized protein n=1 Tax=Oryza sativa subsp. indica TaxID=39946 RepID=B8AJ74_ORYSI|nr:hypothetical protein OsI_09117 [Oryza sativa Indica Group]
MAMLELVQILRAQPVSLSSSSPALSGPHGSKALQIIVGALELSPTCCPRSSSSIGPQIRPEAPPSRSLRARLSADPLLLALDPLSTDPRAAASSMPEPAATIQGSNSLSAILSLSRTPDALKSGQP